MYNALRNTWCCRFGMTRGWHTHFVSLFLPQHLFFPWRQAPHPEAATRHKLFVFLRWAIQVPILAVEDDFLCAFMKITSVSTRVARFLNIVNGNIDSAAAGSES